MLDAARIASRGVPVPVDLVDSDTVSFPVALCVAAGYEARAAGGDQAAIAAAARATAEVVDSVFIVGAPQLALRSGRLGGTIPEPTTILGLGPDGLVDHGTAVDIDDALSLMTERIRAAALGRSLRVGVGDADRTDLGDRLAALVEGATGIDELIRYEIGPSVGSHSGAGTVGAVWAPTSRGM